MGRSRGGVLQAALCGLLVGWLSVGRAWAQVPLAAEEGQRALAEGREAFDALDMERALAQLERARALLSEPGQASLRSEAWSLKVAAQLAQGDVAGAQAEAQRLLAEDPAARFSPDHFPPEALARLERTRWRVRAASAPKPLAMDGVHAAGEAALPLPLGAGRGEGRGDGGRRRVGLGLLAGGVLLLAGGAVLGLKAAGRQAALAPLAQNDPLARTLRYDGRRLALLADVGAAAGLLASAAGAALTLLRPKATLPLPLGEAPPLVDGGQAPRSEGLPVSREPAPPAAPKPAPSTERRPVDADDDLRNH